MVRAITQVVSVAALAACSALDNESLDHSFLHAHGMLHGHHERGSAAHDHAHLHVTHDPVAACVCEGARMHHGWCPRCEVGYVAGFEVRSSLLFETLDAHGHDIEPAAITCPSCLVEIERDGFCPICRIGFAGGDAYFSRLTHALAQGEPCDVRAMTCPTCRAHARRCGWSDSCGLGMVGNTAFRDRAVFNEACGQLTALEAAIRACDRCELCACAIIVGGECPRCGPSGSASGGRLGPARPAPLARCRETA